MRPPRWPPPGDLSTAAHVSITRIRRAKLCVFLRQPRQTLVAEPLPQERLTLYKDQPPGQPPGPPAPLALAPLRPAYPQVAAAAVIEAPTRARRWQLGLDCLACAPP
jgi:hypothetical protein